MTLMAQQQVDQETLKNIDEGALRLWDMNRNLPAIENSVSVRYFSPFFRTKNTNRSS